MLLGRHTTLVLAHKARLFAKDVSCQRSLLANDKPIEASDASRGFDAAMSANIFPVHFAINVAMRSSNVN